LQLSTKKLTRRLNAIVKELEARGIGDFCECPNSDGIHAKGVIASKLFPEIGLIEDPVPICNHHNPRPMMKPKGNGSEMLHRLFLRKELIIAEEEQEISSFAQVFASLPLATRLERLDAISGGDNGRTPKQLKASVFDRLEYQVE